MNETYKLLSEFKTIHPFIFWTAIFLATTLVIIAAWKLARKKRTLKVKYLENQRPKTIVISEKEIFKLISVAF